MEFLGPFDGKESMRSKHPSWQEILDAIERPDGGESVLAHIDECPRCAAESEEARVLLETFDAAEVRDPSSALMERTLEALRRELRSRREAEAASTGPTGSLGAKIREVWATLVADSLKPSLAVRGATHAVPRSLVYETDDFAISLSLGSRSTAKTMSVLGQLIPKRADSLPPGGRIELKAGGSLLQTQISEYGEFRFRDVPQAELEIGVCLGDYRILLTPPA